MTRSMKRVISVLLAVVLVAALCTACAPAATSSNTPASSQAPVSSQAPTSSVGASSEEAKEFSYPMKDADQISIFATAVGYGAISGGYYSKPADVPFLQYLEEYTGIKVDWQFPTVGADTKAALNTLLASEEYPDAILDGVSETYYEDGVVIALDDIIDAYMPNYKAYMEDPYYSEVKKATTATDGKIFSFLSARESLWSNTYVGPYVNKTWLDEQNLKVPTTIADWDNMLRVFKDKYNAQFTSRLGYMGNWENTGFSGAFGGSGSFIASYVIVDGKYTLNATETGWRDYIAQMAKWYKEGLIDPDLLTMADNNAVLAKVDAKETGAIILNLGSAAKLYEDGWVATTFPTDANGRNTYVHNTSNNKTAYSGVITNDCAEERIEEVARWIDFAFSEEGKLVWNLGKEGVCWEYNDKGEAKLTDFMLKDEAGINTQLAKHAGTSGSFWGIQLRTMLEQKNSEAGVIAVDTWMMEGKTEHYKRNAPAGFKFSAETTESVKNEVSAIATLVSEEALKFLVGDRPIEEWDAFVKECYDMGLQKVLDAYQADYDAFMKK